MIQRNYTMKLFKKILKIQKWKSKIKRKAVQYGDYA